MSLTAKEAISRHVQWKMTLQFAIATRGALTDEQIDQITHHTLCAIGRWLDDPDTVARYPAPELLDLRRRHVSFHGEMLTVARLILHREYERASFAMEPFSRFQEASQRLAMAITTLDRGQKMLIPA